MLLKFKITDFFIKKLNLLMDKCVSVSRSSRWTKTVLTVLFEIVCYGTAEFYSRI